MASYSNWQSGVANETGKEIRTPAEAMELVVYLGAELINVGRRIVCQTSKLGVIPDPFVRVQLGSVRRQSVSPKLRIKRKEVANQPRLVVDVESVPDNVHGAPELSAQKTEELHDIFGPDVPVVLQQMEVQAQPLAPGADRDRADGGDPVMAIPTLLDGRLSPRRERSADQGSEHEAGFIEEN